jgi:membrane-bound serine protease (ClpP class)
MKESEFLKCNFIDNYSSPMKIPGLKYYLLLLMLLLSAESSIAKKVGYTKVLVLKIRSEIDPRMSRYVHLALTKATDIKSDYVIINMDTYGGTLDDADKIRKEILNFPKPVFVYINKNAASAGALISLACDSIYMEEGSSIGAATVVTSDGKAAPDKYQSYMRGLMRATAEANGRNPKIAEAMVDQNLKLDSTIKKDGQVITFTTTEALKFGFCDAEVGSINDILKRNHIEDADVVHFELDSTENIISFFLNPYLSGILILIIIGGIYFELQSPGIGFPLIAAIIAGILYFVPYYLNGLAENWEVLAFVIGLGLIIAEIFFIPGFGLAGILGLSLTAVSLVLIMVNNSFFDFTFVASSDFVKALIATFIGLSGSVIFMIFGAERLMSSKMMQKVALHQVLKNDEGFANSKGQDSLVGKQGFAHTTLRPSGKVIIHGQIYDAMTLGDYIENGSDIEVVGQYASYLKVKRVASI